MTKHYKYGSRRWEADVNRLLATKDEDRIYSEYYYFQTGRGIGRTSSNIHFYLIAMGALIVVGGVLLAQSLELTAEPLPFPSVRELVFESPSLSITSPISGSTVTGEAFVIQGTTSNFLTSAVSVQVDSNTPIIATPKSAGDWSTWSLSVIISDAGPHTLTAMSTDEGGNTHTDSITINTGNIPIRPSLYDDFAADAFTLSDGELSPIGKW
jgi:YD repeat-containing protein